MATNYVEVISSAILAVPLTLALRARYMTAHLVTVEVQIVGSIWIRRLSAVWETP